MTLKQQIKHLLEINLEARERSNRYRVVWYILYQRYHNETIDKKMFLEVGPEIESINRCIRQLQQYDESLRGKDYDEGKILSQEKQIELGYRPGFLQDIKKLKTL